jgi:hypothetical protein
MATQDPYDFNSVFQNGYANQPNEMDAKLQRDQFQAQLQQQILQQRQGYDEQNAQRDFANQMQILRASNEYNNASAKTRTALEAQLFAMQKGYLPPEMANQLVMGGSPTGSMPMNQLKANQNVKPEDMLGTNGKGGIDWTEAFAGGAGGYAGYGLGKKYPGANINSGLKGLGRLGTALETGSAQKTLSDMMMKPALKMYKPNTFGMGKSNANLLSNILTKGAVGVRKTAAPKTLLSILAKAGTKTLPKVIGGIGGGIPGMLLGTAIGTGLDNMIFGDDAKKNYMNQMYNGY